MPPLETVALLLRTKSRAPGKMELNPEGSLGAEGNSKQGGSPKGYPSLPCHHRTQHDAVWTFSHAPLSSLPSPLPRPEPFKQISNVIIDL